MKFALLQRVTGKYRFEALMKEPLMRPVSVEGGEMGGEGKVMAVRGWEESW